MFPGIAQSDRDQDHVTTTERPAAKRKTSQPITAHRLFPALVALWFAALFGLGSFAMSPGFIEGIVTAIGLPAVVPAATPPLGFTARALVALAMTVLGGGIGLLVALRLRPQAEVAPRRRFATGKAKPQDDHGPKVRARDAHPDAPPRKPLVLTEDLVSPDETLPSVDGMPLRRRSLSVTDETIPAEPFEFAPVPGHTPFGKPVSAPEPLLAAKEDTPYPAPVAPMQVFEPNIEPAGEPADLVEAVEESPAEPEICAAPPPIAAVAAAIAARDPVAAVSPVAEAPLDALGLVQLIERLALAIAERRKTQESSAIVATRPFVAPVEQPVQQAEPEPEAAFVPPAPSAPFGIARFQPQPAAMASPLASTPFGEDDDDAPGVTVPRFLAITHPAPVEAEAPAPQAGAPDEADADVFVPSLASDDEPPVPEERYPSLIDMAVPQVRQEFVRIEDPADAESDVAEIEPVVIFPGQGPRNGDSGIAPFARPASSPLAAQQAFVPPASALPDPEEADRALRAALATLQRMTAKG